MPTIQNVPEQRVLLSDIGWETYERLLADHQDSSAPRFTYDRGVLEIMSPLPEHEKYNRAIASLVEVVAEERGLDFENLGSTAFRRDDLQRGFEPDSCFYIQHEPAIRGKSVLDLRIDPPPDLVIEIDITHLSLDKLPIYAAIGVPEVWRYDGQRLEMRMLEGDRYVASRASTALPGITRDDVARLIEEGKATRRLAWLANVRDWARHAGRAPRM